MCIAGQMHDVQKQEYQCEAQTSSCNTSQSYTRIRDVAVSVSAGECWHGAENDVAVAVPSITSATRCCLSRRSYFFGGIARCHNRLSSGFVDNMLSYEEHRSKGW